MQDPKELIIEKLKWYLGEMGVSGVESEVSLVGEQKFGDFTTNVAMVFYKEIPGSFDDAQGRQIGDNKGQISNDSFKSPREFAEKVVSKLKESDKVNEIFEKIEVAGPGFINFYLSSDYLSRMLTEIVQTDSRFGALRQENPQKIMVEFGDPNPFKEIHIGHLRNFCIGESFSRLLESQGNEVIRANYQGDVGLHVAKCLWGILQKSGDKSQNLEITVQDLADGYVLGAKQFEENETAKQEIIEINKKIYSDDESLHPLWEEGRRVSLEHFEELYKRIGVSYQKYYFESVTAKKGREIVLQNIDNGVFERDDGAVVYRGEQDGLHTRVFLTSQDYATYEGKDLALAILKSEDVEYDRSVILTGNEQLEYFQVMLAALRKIRLDLAEKTDHYTFGHVRLKEGKMSSRTGDVITASWLLDEAVKQVKALMIGNQQGQVGWNRVFALHPEVSEREGLVQNAPTQEEADKIINEIAEKVGVGAVKYSMLKFSIPQDIHFSFEESISLEGNSGPYLQYTYVRTQSLLEKAGSQWQVVGSKEDNENHVPRATSYEQEEIELLRFVSQYPYHLETAAADFAPNLLCNYLFELSQKFNLLYQKHKIIASEKMAFRLKLTQAVGNVLKDGLSILGIETVERM